MPEQNPFHCFEAQMARIKFIAQAWTQCQLADFLGVKQASISEASKRGNIPPGWLVVLVRKLRVNPDWVLEGRMPVFLGERNGSQGMAQGVGQCYEDLLRHIPLAELQKELCRRGMETQ